MSEGARGVTTARKEVQDDDRWRCAECGQVTGMMGHYRGIDKPFSCQVKKEEPKLPLVERTPEAKQAYHEGYVAALKAAEKKASSLGHHSMSLWLMEHVESITAVWNGSMQVKS